MIIGNVSEPIFRMCGFLVQSEESEGSVQCCNP